MAPGRARLRLVVIVLLLATSAHAQTVNEAARAFALGDYQTARYLLRPIAEPASASDPNAQFLLALIYHAGLGLGGREEPIRACILFTRVAAAPGPFRASAILLRQWWLDHLADREMCTQPWWGRDEHSFALAGLALEPDVETNESRDAQATADGVDALVRGDIARAVQLLKPNAEAFPSRDHIAELFLAGIYGDQRSGSYDPMSSCALYVMVSNGAWGTLGQLVLPFLQACQESSTAREWEQYRELAARGFEQGLKPVTFSLESNHWVSIGFDGFTIGYQGREVKASFPEGPGIFRWLPAEHTELLTGIGTLKRRHFIELFAWKQTSAGWTLGWLVYEVRGAEMPQVAWAESLTEPLERWPADGTFNVHDFARLRVNQNGDVEWSTLSGPQEEHGTI